MNLLCEFTLRRGDAPQQTVLRTIRSQPVTRLTSEQIIAGVLIAIAYDLPAVFNFPAGTRMTPGFYQISRRDREQSDPSLFESPRSVGSRCRKRVVPLPVFTLRARPGGLLTQV